ncbi:hypothetical protein SAMN05216179_2303 [Gracilibacillus kekensis]|uniref:Uncharacterized protein n=1 Tax=Gracilibacillus kekensis TaxID=1027249 RepID=A0A1M7PLB4_9BACI|nr:hypothetical protein SAMN05216179_2303 [Gracilibacillus kekensis]
MISSFGVPGLLLILIILAMFVGIGVFILKAIKK